MIEQTKRGTEPGGIRMPTKRLLVFVGGLIVMVVILVIFREIFWPLLLAVAIAYLLDPGVTWLERRRVPRTLGVLITGFLFLLAIAVALVFVVPAIGDQLHRLAERLPRYWESLSQAARPWIWRIESELPGEAHDLPQAIIRAIQTHIPQLAASAGKIITGLFGNLLDVVLLILSLAFVVVFTFYVLRDLPRIKASAFDLVPVPYREAARQRLDEVDAVVAGFVRGQLTIAAINGAIFSIGLTLLGVPMGLLVGLAAGLGNLVPYMSIVLGMVPALLLSWLEQQSLGRLLAVLGLFAAVQAMEDLVLRPRILARHVKLHPVWILLAVIAGGKLFGFFGMILAVPVAGTIQVFLRDWLAAYRSSPLYWGSHAEGPGIIRVEGPPGQPPPVSPAGGQGDRGEERAGADVTERRRP